MEVQEIMTVVQGLAERTFTPAEMETLTVLCGESAKRWKARLRASTALEEIRGVFVLACAWSTLAVWEEISQAAVPLPRSFTAGALRVDRDGDSSAGARSLERQAEVLMAPYVQDNTFAFLEVMG